MDQPIQQQEVRGLKVDLCVFTYRSGPVTPQLAIQAMDFYAQEQGVDVRKIFYGNALIDKARNEALQKCRPDADFILFIDDDMIPQPDALVSSLKLNLPIVIPLFTTRCEPVAYTVKMYDPGNDEFVSIAEFNDSIKNKVVEGAWGAGMAYALLRRDAIEQVREYHLSAKDWMDDNQAYFNRLKVRSENRETERARREAMRRKAFKENDRYACLFERWKCEENEMVFGEDIGFCRKMIRAGVPIYLDTRESSWVGHMGEYAYGPWDMGDKVQPIREKSLVELGVAV